MRDDIAERIAAAIHRAPGASITLRLAPSNASGLGAEVGVALRAGPASTRGQLLLALNENGLSNPVKAGENRGKHLRHDFVVRELAGPFAVAAEQGLELRHVPLAASWKVPQLAVAAFVQDAATGDVLQALSLAVCG